MPLEAEGARQPPTGGGSVGGGSMAEASGDHPQVAAPTLAARVGGGKQRPPTDAGGRVGSGGHVPPHPNASPMPVRICVGHCATT